MSYSACDFSDDVFNELGRVGAIQSTEFNDDNLEDNLGLQAEYALTAIDRLVAVRDAAIQYQAALLDFVKRNNISLQDGVLCEANERLRAALREVKQPDQEVV